MKMMNRGRGMAIKRSKVMPAPVSKGFLCGYPHRVCMRNRIDGYEYCCKHILEDKSAPYRQCNYVYPKNGRRCSNAASKLERRDGYCFDHTRKSALLRQSAFRKRKPVETATSLIDDLDHYNLIENGGTGDELPTEFSPSLLSRLPLAAPLNQISKIIDYATDSDSDCEILNVDQTYKGVVESDAESVDSENEDILRHAGVYTVEEATLLARDKLIRLQSLYIGQFKRLQHVLREKRRKYLHNIKMEKETFSNPNAFLKSSAKEMDHYTKLKALLNYHKLNGIENLMRLQSKEKRIAITQGVNYIAPYVAKCFHSTKDGEKCLAKPLPFSKFCVTHILEDSKQVLYRPCSLKDSNCTNPVTYGINMKTCNLHRDLPPIPTLDLPPPPPPPIKTEDEELEKMDTQEPESEILEVMPVTSQSEVGANINPDKMDSDVFLPITPLWEPSEAESKLRQVLESIDMTPGELPPEELLDTS